MSMTSRERMLAAIKSQEVDHIPFTIEWNQSEKKHTRLPWNTEREKLAWHQMRGMDNYLNAYASVTPLPEVKVEKIIIKDENKEILCQTWKTPAGDLTEKVKITVDWDAHELKESYLKLNSDFRTPRYIEFPIKDMKDLEALEYIFPLKNPKDTEEITKSYNERRKLADEFNCPLFVYFDAGMDWLMWLFPTEEFITRVVEQPEFVARLLDHLNQAKLNRLELLLQLGVDGVIRRGWYESTDIWSPRIYRKFAKPVLEKEIDLVHAAGKAYIYLMVTGIQPLLPDLADLPFDCIYGPEPALGGQDLRQIHDALPCKAFWGGISGPEHFGAKTPDKAEQAVENIISIYGKRGLVLGMGASFRHYWPFENFEAAERAWRRLR